MAILWTIVSTLPWTPFALFGRRKGRPGFLLLCILSITGFWCLTSRVPLAYLFPVIPLFAAWLAGKVPHEHLRRAFPYAAVIALLVTVGALLVCRYTTSKMPGDFFREERDAHPEATFSFVKKAPYSAEFYFGKRLHPRPEPEDILLERCNHSWRRVEP